MTEQKMEQAEKKVPLGCEFLSRGGLESVLAAARSLREGDGDSALEALAELSKVDIDPVMSMLNQLGQIVQAVGLNHQLSGLLEWEAVKERERLASAERGQPRLHPGKVKGRARPVVDLDTIRLTPGDTRAPVVSSSPLEGEVVSGTPAPAQSSQQESLTSVSPLVVEGRVVSQEAADLLSSKATDWAVQLQGESVTPVSELQLIIPTRVTVLDDPMTLWVKVKEYWEDGRGSEYVAMATAFLPDGGVTTTEELWLTCTVAVPHCHLPVFGEEAPTYHNATVEQATEHTKKFLAEREKDRLVEAIGLKSQLSQADRDMLGVFPVVEPAVSLTPQDDSPSAVPPTVVDTGLLSLPVQILGDSTPSQTPSQTS